jgi:hypothetical protein
VSRGAGVLLDDRRHPSVRTVVGSLLARAGAADFAIARVRLTAVDLSERELGSVERCRVLLGRLDADTLSAPLPAQAADGGGEPGRLEALHRFLASGRVAVRTAGATLWLPDFSVLSGLPAQDGITAGGVCLVGAHYFARPYPTRGPALTCLLTDRDSVAAAAERFEELWDLGYDVLPVIIQTLDALRAVALSP